MNFSIHMQPSTTYHQNTAFWEITLSISFNHRNNMFTCGLIQNPFFQVAALSIPQRIVLMFSSSCDATRAPRFEMEMRNNLFCPGNGNFPLKLSKDEKACPAASLKRSLALRNLCLERKGIVSFLRRMSKSLTHAPEVSFTQESSEGFLRSNTPLTAGEIMI